MGRKRGVDQKEDWRGSEKKTHREGRREEELSRSKSRLEGK